MASISIELSAEMLGKLTELAERCSEADENATSHGPLDVVGLLTMLAEDAVMVIDRPGSWEGSNMATVLTAHGYDV